MVRLGILVTFDSGTYRAVVAFDRGGSESDVPVATHLSSGMLPSGARVVVVESDTFLPESRVVVGVVGP